MFKTAMLTLILLLGLPALASAQESPGNRGGLMGMLAMPTGSIESVSAKQITVRFDQQTRTYELSPNARVRRATHTGSANSLRAGERVRLDHDDDGKVITVRVLPNR